MIPKGFSNDAIFICSECEIGIMCFTTIGDTSFCPSCGYRNECFEQYECTKEGNLIREESENNGGKE